jgi:succinate dehydrogenase/fumarate reductase flavoprotein subunit
MAKTKTKTAAPAAKKTASLRNKTKQIYFIELTLDKTTYHGGGLTVVEAIEDMVQSVPLIVKRNPKIKGIFRATKDGRVVEKYQYPVQLRRFFVNEINRALWAKMLTSGLA